MDGGKLKVKDANLLLQNLVAAIIVDNDLGDIPFDNPFLHLTVLYHTYFV